MRSKRSAEAVAAPIRAVPTYDERTVLETDTYHLLADLDGTRRARIGAHLKIALNGKNGDDARALALALLAPGVVEALWEAADPIERVLLRAASATPSIGRGTLTRCALDRRHSPAEIDQRIAKLEREGILLWREVGFSPAFHVPSEIAGRLRAAALEDMVGPQVAARPDGPIADHGGAFLDDLVTALGFLKRGSYRVTRSGAVHAADLRRLAARFVYPEDVDGEAVAPMPAEPVPSRLGLILDLVRRLLLVRFDPDDVRVDDRRTRTWLDRQPDEIRRDLVKAARREPWRYQREVSAVADFLSDRKPGEWVYVEDVARALEYHPDFLGSRPEHLRARVQAGATFLCFLGVAAVSPQEVRPDAVSLTPLGKRLLGDEALAETPVEEARLTVLPTFEVLLPSAAPLVVRYALEVVADPDNGRVNGRAAAGNPVRTYRLEKRTLLQALKGGQRLDDVQAFLAKHALEIPDNVRISLEDWARAYGEYYFMNPTLLVCRDAAAAAAAKSDPKVAERVLGQLTPEILILSEGSVEPVRASLEANGSMPRAGIEEIPPSQQPDRSEKVAAITRFVLKRATDRALLDDRPTNGTGETPAPLAAEGPADAPRPDRTLAITEALLRIRGGERPADAPEGAEGGPETEERRKAKLCDITGCGRPHAARGLCTLHYQAARRGKISFPSV